MSIKIRWTKDVELEFYAIDININKKAFHEQKTNIAFKREPETIKQGEITEVRIITINPQTVDMQFLNGSAARNVPKNCFEKI